MQRGTPAVRGFRLRPASPTNPQMQKLEIKRGAYGLGAFAVEPIRELQFIGGTVFHLTTWAWFVHVQLRVYWRTTAN